jgi:hypothetical protein
VVLQSAPKPCLGKTRVASFGSVWVLSRVGKGVQALKLLDLAASVPGHEGTNQPVEVSSIGVNDAECGPRAR